MGCYGIGGLRVVGAAIEQHNDDKGIVWPVGIAPFQVVLVPMQYHRLATRARGDRAALPGGCWTRASTCCSTTADARPA